MLIETVEIAQVSDLRNCGATTIGPKASGLPHSIRHRWHCAGNFSEMRLYDLISFSSQLPQQF
jgi:hypothetical protein